MFSQHFAIGILNMFLKLDRMAPVKCCDPLLGYDLPFEEHFLNKIQ